MKVAEKKENVKKKKIRMCTGHGNHDVEISQIYISFDFNFFFFNVSSVERRNRNKL